MPQRSSRRRSRLHSSSSRRRAEIGGAHGAGWRIASGCPAAMSSATVQRMDTVAQAHHQGHVVLDHKNAATMTVADRENGMAQVLGFGGGEPRRRLVEQRKRGPGQCPRQSAAVPLVARRDGGLPSTIGQLDSPVIAKACRLASPRPMPRPTASTFSATVNPLKERARPGTSARYRIPQRHWAQARSRSRSPSRICPPCGRWKPESTLTSRLAGTVGSDQAQYLAGSKRDRHIVDRQKPPKRTVFMLGEDIHALDFPLFPRIFSRASGTSPRSGLRQRTCPSAHR